MATFTLRESVVNKTVKNQYALAGSPILTSRFINPAMVYLSMNTVLSEAETLANGRANAGKMPALPFHGCFMNDLGSLCYSPRRQI
ncbi:MAG: hypothetical protein ACFE0I_14175 [Elainellaceae cyanobacterium]